MSIPDATRIYLRDGSIWQLRDGRWWLVAPPVDYDTPALHAALMRRIFGEERGEGGATAS